MPFENDQLDFRPLLKAVIADRRRGRPIHEIARAFHSGIALAIVAAASHLCASHQLDTVVLSGGVFQNALLLQEARAGLMASGLRVWTNQQVPANDGGLSLGQAALAAVHASTGRE